MCVFVCNYSFVQYGQGIPHSWGPISWINWLVVVSDFRFIDCQGHHGRQSTCYHHQVNNLKHMTILQVFKIVPRPHTLYVWPMLCVCDCNNYIRVPIVYLRGESLYARGDSSLNFSSIQQFFSFSIFIVATVTTFSHNPFVHFFYCNKDISLLFWVLFSALLPHLVDRFLPVSMNSSL